VTLTATNGVSTTTASKPVAVVPRAVAPVGSFDFAQQASPARTVQFTDTSTGSPAVSGWAWDFGDGQTSIEKDPVHTYATAGTYTVTLTVTNGTPGAEVSRQVVVTAPAVSPPSGGGGGGGSGVMPDTELSVVTDRSSVPVGETFTLQASVRLKNQLVSSGAGNVVLTYGLPANVDLVSVSTDRGSCSPLAGRTLVCNLGFIANVLVPHVPIVLRVTGAGEIVSSLSTKTDEPDPDPSNNAVTVKVNSPVSAPLTPPTPPRQPTTDKGLTKVGTAKGETLRGTRFADRLDGRGGTDRIFGYAGKDILTGGKGRDVILAGLGNDTVDVRDGEVDTVDCGAGTDTVVADKTDKLTNCEKVIRKTV
jgi:PKD repeat protein